jgi:phage baseplate assembly protein W
MEDRHLLTDVGLALRHSELRPVYDVATERRPVPPRRERLLDLGVVSGGENLGQAIIMRLLTPRGELSELAHPEYGSRLHELIGRQNTETTRNLIKLFILESLQAEPRVEEVLEVAVEPVPDKPDSVSVLLRVKPVGTTSTLTIGPFTLELEQ